MNKFNSMYSFPIKIKEIIMNLNLVEEPDFYSPSINDKGDYVDKIPSFTYINKGLKCPCGSRKGKVYETYNEFSRHIKTKCHEKWIEDLNMNKMNHISQNTKLNDLVDNQKIIIAKLQKEVDELKIYNKNLKSDIFEYQKEIDIYKNKNNNIIENLLDFD